MLNKIRQSKHTPFWLITCSVLIGLTLPVLIQDGMFMDAMLYTSVSHNLSMGIGTFWFPQFSLHNVAGLNSFHEQPPLVFGIQALFYNVFGDSMYVERFYTFITMCISASLVYFLWKAIYRKEVDLSKMGWLPIFIWITIPVCFWSYSNNMHENTMGIFTLWSVLLTYKAFNSPKIPVAMLVFSGILIVLATLSKGIPGLFPVVVPFLYWVSTKKINFSKTFIYTSILVFTIILSYVILILIPVSRESLSIYFFKRVLHRINELPTVDSRFYIIGHLFMELIPQLVLVAILFLISKIKKIEILASAYFTEALFFIAVGLSASIPLMFTLVQKGFYLVPSLPFFAIGFSISISPVVEHLINKINVNGKKNLMFIYISFCLLVIIIAVSFAQLGKTSRNKELLHDIYLIGKVIPQKSVVSVPTEMWGNWDLQCNLIRYFNISLESNFKNNYCVFDRNLIKSDSLILYEKVEIPTVQFDLYKRK